ncbi:MAG: MOSC domain-containing protein [Chroococcidiopsidaceae cyanobacterium CP_BM_ER_R8_30]|nr:MOSC domain-containing protein [Chroococcidiopsidaceae cyanobacterium CP_BM_ER_R8_30]
MTTVRVKQLFSHPIKGLTPQAMESVDLQAGHGVPGDRAFALMYDNTTTDNASSVVPWMKKQNFAMQCDWPGLAGLACHYDPTTKILTVKRQEIELLVAETDTVSGRDRIGAFFTGYLAAIYPSQTAKHPERAALRLVGESGKTRYPDRNVVHISLISAATINQLSEIAGHLIDVRRFRPNIVLEGISAWEEFSWVEQEFELGQARIAITAPINRCLNIDVNPDTGERDIPLLSLLQKHFQHKQTGVLAKVITTGPVALGDTLSSL